MTPPADIGRVHVRVEGTVQGVFFRATTQAKAQSLGLRGWVRNRRDGSVELVAEGPPAALDQLCEWCLEGPQWATVTGLERTDAAPVGLGPGFVVRPSA